MAHETEKEGTGGTPPHNHVPLDETLARAAARLSGTGQTKPASRHRPPRPATPPPPAAPGRRESAAQPRAPAQPVIAPQAPPTEEMPRVGRTLLMATGVTVTVIAALLLGVRAYKAPSPEPVTAGAPATIAAPRSIAAPKPTAEQRPIAALRPTAPPTSIAAPASVVAPPPAPSRPVEAAPRSPREVSVVVERDPRWGQAEIVHTVAPGETLWGIAERYTRDPWAWPQLAARSGIENPDLIQPGDKVRIVFVPR